LEEKTKKNKKGGMRERRGTSGERREIGEKEELGGICREQEARNDR
jgi:hypothetical protein